MSYKDVKHDSVTVDAKNQILGRLASEVATILMGKKKPNYVPYMDNGDKVVVVNAKLVKVTGKKESQKTYSRHSGFPGGYREEVFGKLRETNPEKIIIHAVKGMLPKSKLGKQMIKKLSVYAAAAPMGAKKEFQTAKVEEPVAAETQEGESA